MLLVLSMSIYKYIKQDNLAECKPRIEMGKMAGNGPRLLALLTAPPLSFFYGGVSDSTRLRKDFSLSGNCSAGKFSGMATVL